MIPYSQCPTAYIIHLHQDATTPNASQWFVPGKYLLRFPFAQWTMGGILWPFRTNLSTMGIAWVLTSQTLSLVSAFNCIQTTNRIDAAFNCEIGNSTDIALHLNSYPTSGTKRLNYTQRHCLNWHVCIARLTMAFLGVYRGNTQDNGSLPLWKITKHHYGERYHRGTMSLSFFPLALKCVHKNNYGGGTRPCTTVPVQTRSSTSEQSNKT